MPEDLVPTGGPLEPIMPPEAPRPASQIGLILFALVCSNIFALFVTLIFEFLSLRGVVDVNASRLVLVAAWGSGVVIICAFAWGKGIRAKWQTVVGGSLLLAAVLGGLDLWAPKPEIVVDPSRLLFEAFTPREVYALTVRSKVDFNAYSVQVKMTLSQSSSADFSFNTPSPRPILEGSALTDIQGLRCTDRNKQAVVMFWIYRMEPGSTREIDITHSSNSNAIINSKVTYFTSKQVPRTADKTTTTGTFHFDEPLTCSGDIMFQLPASVAPPPPPKEASFAFVVPGVWVNGSAWDFIINHRGPDPCYNVDLLFTDEVKRDSLKGRANLTAAELVSDKALVHYPEIDPKGHASIFAKQLLWTPVSADHERYAIDATWRDGRIHEDLQIERVKDSWFWAMQIKDIDSGSVLINCKDSGFPYGASGQMRCFPEMSAP